MFQVRWEKNHGSVSVDCQNHYTLQAPVSKWYANYCTLGYIFSESHLSQADTKKSMMLANFFLNIICNSPKGTWNINIDCVDLGQASEFCFRDALSVSTSRAPGIQMSTKIHTIDWCRRHVRHADYTYICTYAWRWPREKSYSTICVTHKCACRGHFACFVCVSDYYWYMFDLFKKHWQLFQYRKWNLNICPPTNRCDCEQWSSCPNFAFRKFDGGKYCWVSRPCFCVRTPSG